MKTTVNYNELQMAVSSVSSMINKKANVPILLDLLIEVKSTGLTVTAANLDNYIYLSRSIWAESEVNFSFCVNAESLSKLFKIKSTGLLDIELTDGKVIFSIGGKSATFTALNSDEFVKVPEFTHDWVFGIDSEHLNTGLSKCVDFLGCDELRPVMMGVFVEKQDNAVRFSATDAWKVMRYTNGNFSQSDTPVRFIMPGHIAKYLLKYGIDGSSYLFCVGENMIKVSAGDTVLYFNPIQGLYPVIDKVIPDKSAVKTIAEVDRKELIDILKTLPILNSGKSIELSFNGKCEVVSKDIDSGEEFRTSMPCEKIGDDFRIGFNRDFTITVLKNLSTEKVTFNLTEPHRGAVIDSDESTFTMLMPVHLR